MRLLDWVKEHLVEPLMPPLPPSPDDRDDRLFNWIESEHEALRRQIESERDIILRRAREREAGDGNGDHEEHSNGLV